MVAAITITACDGRRSSRPTTPSTALTPVVEQSGAFSLSESAARSGRLLVTKECSAYTGTGKFRHFQGQADVTYLCGPNWKWKGTYSFGGDARDND